MTDRSCGRSQVRQRVSSDGIALRESLSVATSVFVVTVRSILVYEV